MLSTSHIPLLVPNSEASLLSPLHSWETAPAFHLLPALLKSANPFVTQRFPIALTKDPPPPDLCMIATSLLTPWTPLYYWNHFPDSPEPRARRDVVLSRRGDLHRVSSVSKHSHGYFFLLEISRRLNLALSLDPKWVAIIFQVEPCNYKHHRVHTKSDSEHEYDTDLGIDLSSWLPLEECDLYHILSIFFGRGHDTERLFVCRRANFDKCSLMIKIVMRRKSD